jgi:hypothetical protein
VSKIKCLGMTLIKISLIESRKLRWVWQIGCFGKKGNEQDFVWETSLERPRHGWEDDINESYWHRVDGSSGCGQEPVTNSFEHDSEPSGSTKWCKFLD